MTDEELDAELFDYYEGQCKHCSAYDSLFGFFGGDCCRRCANGEHELITLEFMGNIWAVEQRRKGIERRFKLNRQYVEEYKAQKRKSRRLIIEERIERRKMKEKMDELNNNK